MTALQAISCIFVASLGFGLSISNAMEPRDASYFCTVEFAGGIAFNQTLNKWESSKFRLERKFALKLKYLANRTVKDFAGKDETVRDFNISLTEADSNSSSICYSTNKDWSATVPISEDSLISCSTGLIDHRFNLKANRFLESYLTGFIDGNDNSDNTPTVMGGTCTKID